MQSRFAKISFLNTNNSVRLFFIFFGTSTARRQVLLLSHSVNSKSIHCVRGAILLTMWARETLGKEDAHTQHNEFRRKALSLWWGLDKPCCPRTKEGITFHGLEVFRFQRRRKLKEYYMQSIFCQLLLQLQQSLLKPELMRKSWMKH